MIARCTMITLSKKLIYYLFTNRVHHISKTKNTKINQIKSYEFHQGAVHTNHTYCAPGVCQGVRIILEALLMFKIN